MKLGTKLAVGVTVLAAAMVASATGVIRPPWKMTGDDESWVQLTAIWDPSPRREGVQIYVFIGGELLPDHPIFKQAAPSHHAQAVKKGTPVEIHAKLVGADTALVGCSISINGLEGMNAVNRAGVDGTIVKCNDVAR